MSVILFLLIVIFTLAGISLHISISFSKKEQFDKVIQFFLIYVMIHSAHAFLVRMAPAEYKYIDYAAPFGLLYGPLLFFAYLASVSKVVAIRTFLLHSFPFIVALPCYIFLLYRYSHFHEWSMYYRFLYGTMALSWLGYAVFVAYMGTSKREGAVPGNKNLILTVTVILLTLSFFMIMVVATRIFKGMRTESLSSGLIIFTSMLSAVIYAYLYSIRRFKESIMIAKVGLETEKKNQGEEVVLYQKSGLQDHEMSVYANKVDRYLEAKKYLDPKLSLDKMAFDLNIPKHHLSQLFSQYYGQSFLKFVNGLRIDYACELLKRTDYNFSIDELAERCGFSSKTAFYRNFRNKTKMTPSEYRESLELDSKSF